MNTPVPGAAGGFPSNFAGVRDRLYLNEGTDANGRSRFREVGRLAGLEPNRLDHGLGAVFTDADGDGRLDLYVANDLDPNRLYLNVAQPRRARLPPRRARAPAATSTTRTPAWASRSATTASTAARTCS